ncbi:hypothetical protein M427DRAFT_53569 [Gonapodya prolifera JEL478]|uniref:Uncharacterized protein n=1 Tax=Gonapodya prolifera (strain JEL478) TaxID=1344416 RepID=A0A139APG1_GONPJ|nr:hypothetical protein M427DRAFT_53569 [Gonapodya prolifera JEL478]|eukprot:KXS18612.1 hypothetical protein M427DRAFT_53569 [Gonapodya prolifera JEL478]
MNSFTLHQANSLEIFITLSEQQALSWFCLMSCIVYTQPDRRSNPKLVETVKLSHDTASTHANGPVLPLDTLDIAQIPDTQSQSRVQEIQKKHTICSSKWKGPSDVLSSTSTFSKQLLPCSLPLPLISPTQNPNPPQRDPRPTSTRLAERTAQHATEFRSRVCAQCDAAQ